MNNTNLAQKLDNNDSEATGDNSPMNNAKESVTNSANTNLKLATKTAETNSASDPLDQILMKKTKREHVKDFGLVMACFLTIIAGFQVYFDSDRENIALTLTAVACSFYLACVYLPRAMLPVFSGWMFIGKYLEKIMTGLILGLMWMVTFLPIGLIFKLIGKSTLSLKLDKNAKSYWEDCASDRADFQLLERQY